MIIRLPTDIVVELKTSTTRGDFFSKKKRERNLPTFESRLLSETFWRTTLFVCYLHLYFVLKNIFHEVDFFNFPLSITLKWRTFFFFIFSHNLKIKFFMQWLISRLRWYALSDLFTLNLNENNLYIVRSLVLDAIVQTERKKKTINVTFLYMKIFCSQSSVPRISRDSSYSRKKGWDPWCT